MSQQQKEETFLEPYAEVFKSLGLEIGPKEMAISRLLDVINDEIMFVAGLPEELYTDRRTAESELAGRPAYLQARLFETLEHYRAERGPTQ